MTQVTITINANGPAEIAQVAAALAALGGTAKVEAPKAAAAKPETKAPAKAETKVAEPAAEPAAEEATIEDDAAATIDDVKEAAKAYNVKNGRDALAALIGEHGGSKGVTTIPEGNYQAFIDAANG